MEKKLNIIEQDGMLQPFEQIITGRHLHMLAKEAELLTSGSSTLSDFASGYLYFGLHKNENGDWVFREWAPHATDIYLIGGFSNWQAEEKFRLKRIENGVWEVVVSANELKHEDLYKLLVHWSGGAGERVPAWANRVVQDDETKIFCAQIWDPSHSYHLKNQHFTPNTAPLLIYECHIGMAQEAPEVGSYIQFKEVVLPKIAALGYNCIQIMAIQEHPYYGSFGYHVSSFFAASSRFGTPEELKELIDAAHGLGIAVIMDIVHSHAVKNEIEGVGNFAGDPNQYFYPGDRREHPAWDSLCFDYGKNEVLHFLLSNCKYWLEVYHFDGFRFDGVTSMLYHSHGLGESYMEYENYYNGHQDEEAICYLMLANKLIHQVNVHAITVAEEVSGMPGLADSIENGGYGFDYRMAMNIPDFWIKLIKERIDEDWKPSTILWELTNRRENEKTISYAESHDQALVGDKTIIFRLIDADMYWHMQKGDQNYVVNRGIALHKMIRLITLSTINGGYLNFMGNEFGHPEWIDFPRQGNNWSHHYARRQWSLAENQNLVYHFLSDFDQAMIHLIRKSTNFNRSAVQEVWHHDGDQVMAYERNGLLFIFNFHPAVSFVDYGFLVAPGAYSVLLNSDSTTFGGNGLADDYVIHFTIPDPLYVTEKKEWMKIYLPARTAVVLKRR